MSKTELRNNAVAFVLTALGFVYGGPTLGFVLLFLGLALFISSIYRKEDTDKSVLHILAPSPERILSPLEKAQLEQLKLDQLIKSLAELILIWVANRKTALENPNLVFSEDVLRDLLRDDADRLHIVMNYLVDKGRAKRAIGDYWSVD